MTQHENQHCCDPSRPFQQQFTMFPDPNNRKNDVNRAIQNRQQSFFFATYIFLDHQMAKNDFIPTMLSVLIVWNQSIENVAICNFWHQTSRPFTRFQHTARILRPRPSITFIILSTSWVCKSNRNIFVISCMMNCSFQRWQYLLVTGNVDSGSSTPSFGAFSSSTSFNPSLSLHQMA